MSDNHRVGMLAIIMAAIVIVALAAGFTHHSEVVLKAYLDHGYHRTVMPNGLTEWNK